MLNGTRVGVGGRVAVGEGVNVMATVDVDTLAGLLLGMGVFPLAEMKGSYVGKVAGSSMLRVQETSRLASSTAEVILEKDMDVILPKDEFCK